MWASVSVGDTTCELETGIDYSPPHAMEVLTLLSGRVIAAYAGALHVGEYPDTSELDQP